MLAGTGHGMKPSRSRAAIAIGPTMMAVDRLVEALQTRDRDGQLSDLTASASQQRFLEIGAPIRAEQVAKELRSTK